MLRFSTFAVLVTVVGTFLLRKLVNIVDMNIGGKDEHAMDGTPNPNKCTHNLRAISTKIEIILSAPSVQIENSTDLSLGRRPDSKSVEFSICTERGVEL